MARIVVVAGTDAGYKVADVLSAAGHQVAREQALDGGCGGDLLFIEAWLYGAGLGASGLSASSLGAPALGAGGRRSSGPGSSISVDAPVIIIAPPEALSAAVHAVQQGAYDILRVPSSADEMRLMATRALRHLQLMRENASLRSELDQYRHSAAPHHSTLAEPEIGLPVDRSADPIPSVARNLAGKPLADIEKQVILSTLEQFKGHRLKTAAALGIGVRTLGMKIKRWREEGEPIAGRQVRQPVHVDLA
jgi:hypothetical protein